MPSLAGPVSGPALPPLTVTGDVGFLADENAQRLVSIYVEEISDTLTCLREAVHSHVRLTKGACPRATFERGLAVLQQCSADALVEQVAAMQARYPETDVLHRYVLVSLLSEAAYAEAMTSLVLPTVVETYHAFARRVALHPDARQGLAFLDQPLAARRVVYLDAFRNAMHDQARHYAGRQVTARPPQSLFQPGSGGSDSGSTGSLARAPVEKGLGGGSLQAAMNAARSRSSEASRVGGSQTTTSRAGSAGRGFMPVGSIGERGDAVPALPSPPPGGVDDSPPDEGDSGRAVLLVDTFVPPRAVRPDISASDETGA